MLSKNKLKYLRSLSLKKNRDAEGCFLAEGPKVVGDLSVRFACKLLAATESYLHAHPRMKAEETVVIDEKELRAASLLQAPRDVIAVFRKNAPGMDAYAAGEAEPPALPARTLCLALDRIQDPGNLGTIIRLADWFGIEHLVCSRDCADAYAPKTVQATMGSLARVAVSYTDLPRFLRSLPQETPVYGTFLDGDDIYAAPLSDCGVLVMGNEGNGISADVRRLVNRRLLIPNYPPGRATGESLNVAVATAVACAEFRRRQRPVPTSSPIRHA